jgi:hypothetical protein
MIPQSRFFLRWPRPFLKLKHERAFERILVRPYASLVPLLRFVFRGSTVWYSLVSSHPCVVSVGSHIECIYSLMTFGIPDFVIPIEASGEVNLNHHLYFLKRERAKEEELRVLTSPQQTVALRATNSLDQIVVPDTLDILHGRGSSVQFHTGNIVRLNVFLFLATSKLGIASHTGLFLTCCAATAVSSGP